MRRLFLSLSLASLAWLVAGPVLAEPVGRLVSTPRGAPIEVIVTWPDPARHGPGPYPALVLSSGGGYHQRLPLQVAVAQGLAAQGVAVLRFDWAYRVRHGAQGQASAGLLDEEEDFATALAHARADPRIDARRIAVGGKSQGTMLAWRWFARDASLRALVQLTPLCSRPAEDGKPVRPVAEARYPGFVESMRASGRPVLFVLGDRDPGCLLEHLRPFAAPLGEQAHLAEVGGDHSLAHPQLPPPEADAALQGSIAAAVRAVHSFLAETLR
jgi:predicted alpha/beta-hydrolase family hydrolase